MRPIVTGGIAWSVITSIAKTAEPIDMPFGLWTPWVQGSMYWIWCILAPPGEYD